jgi:predicted Zn-dependent peptidase
LIELQRVDQRADALSMFETLFRDPERINSELDRILSVTAAAVRAFAARYLKGDNRVLLIYVPRSAVIERATVPAQGAIRPFHFRASSAPSSL